jgi:hypothetical protein
MRQDKELQPLALVPGCWNAFAWRVDYRRDWPDAPRQQPATRSFFNLADKAAGGMSDCLKQSTHRKRKALTKVAGNSRLCAWLRPDEQTFIQSKFPTG